MKSNPAHAENSALSLGHSYQGILRRRINELRAFSARCREGRLTADEIEDIHLRVRSLVGSGTTYGYPAVSAAADPLDQALDSPSITGLKTLATLVDGLTDACSDALLKEIAAPDSNILVFQSTPSPVGKAKPLMLLVDDDPAIHDLVKIMFRDMMRFVSAYNGDEAMEAVRQFSPDLIVLDDYMPGIAGLKLLEQLSTENNSASTPVIMLTAADEPHQIMRAAAIGIADYVIKPFDPRMLVGKIQAAVRRMQTTVLVGHGNPVMRNLIACRLRRSGLMVVEAANARDALASAAARMPELILIDQSMPGMESGGALYNLRTDPHTRHIPILYITADHKGRGMVENLDAGTVEPVTMPSPPEKIAARIIEALGFASQPS